MRKRGVHQEAEHQQEGGGMSTILVSEDDARQIMKRFLKGTCSVLFCSILLLFLLFFMRERRTQELGSPEQDALRPFDLETPKSALRR